MLPMSRTPQRPRRSPPDCSIIGNSGTHCIIKNILRIFPIIPCAALGGELALRARKVNTGGPACGPPSRARACDACTCGGAPAVRPALA